MTTECFALEKHLRDVAALAADSASTFESSEWAYLAGYWHDIGKLRALTGGCVGEADNHALLSAAHASAQLGPKAFPLELAIACHHTGLQNKMDVRRRLQEFRGGPARPPGPGDPVQGYSATPPAFLSTSCGDPGRQARALEFWIRMIFSTVVDANQKAGGSMEESDAGAGPWLRGIVDDVTTGGSDCCRAEHDAYQVAARDEPGFFSIGHVPESDVMAFGLAHAETWKMCRLILVSPDAADLVERAAFWSDVIGGKYVTEDLDWSRPIVCTTAQQLFEVLHSADIETVRKLHHIAGSVVLLHRVTRMPQGYALPIVDALAELARNYRTSICLSSSVLHAVEREPEFVSLIPDARDVGPQTEDKEGCCPAAADEHHILPMRQALQYRSVAEQMKLARGCQLV